MFSHVKIVLSRDIEIPFPSSTLIPFRNAVPSKSNGWTVTLSDLGAEFVFGGVLLRRSYTFTGVVNP